MSDVFESSLNQGLICSAPNAQLSPTPNKFACLIECQKASTVWPDNVLPLASVIVPETKIGSLEFSSSRSVLTAYRAALQLSVSKTVSIKNKSTLPSYRPLACS